jgi:cyclophilin family peptidyl-prolyl cis-trans isomerase
MPKTASKRAQARKDAKINRAHQISHAVPAAGQQRPRPKGRSGLQNYPWATGILILLLIGFGVLVMHQQRLWLWAPPAPPAQATCNLKTHVCTKAPLNVLQADKTYTATIKTDKGTIVIQLNTKNAPSYVNSFVFLSEHDFYNGLDFSKVERLNQVSPETNQPSNIDLIQGGKGGDAGGPGYTLKAASAQGQYTLGVVAMANASQFFINTADNSSAITSTSYPIIGDVTAGLNVAKAITLSDKIISITISSTTVVPTPTAGATPTAGPTSTVPATATP